MDDVARELGVTDRRVRSLIKAGALPAEKVMGYGMAIACELHGGALSGGSIDRSSDPFEPVLNSTVSVPHPNMLRLSPDNRRLYVSNSLLTTWDDDARFGPPRNDDYGIWLFQVEPASGRLGAGEVVLAGYGIVAEEHGIEKLQGSGQLVDRADRRPLEVRERPCHGGRDETLPLEPESLLSIEASAVTDFASGSGQLLIYIRLDPSDAY